MAKTKTKKESLDILEKLDAELLEKVAEFAGNEKVIALFKSKIKFPLLKGYVKNL